MAVLDIFNNNAFSTASMIAALENTEFQPTRLADLNIFKSNPIRTESVGVEMRDNGSFKLIQTTPRGAPLIQATQGKRRVRSFQTTRIGQGDRILASELAFVRQFGDEQAVMEVQKEIGRRWNGPGGLIGNVDLTLENMRLGAIQGKFIDADGSTIEDWVTAFDAPGSTPTTIQNITFDFSTLVDGKLREKLVKLRRDIMRTSDGVGTNQTKIHAMVGDDFFDELGKNQEIREFYGHHVKSGAKVAGNDAFDTIEYAGFTFENYRGTDDNATVAIDVDKGHMFPTNTNGAFEHVKAPGESFADQGTTGKDYYSLLTPDRDHDRYVDMEIITYPLFICMRPKMLRSLELV